jgi:hypothetical protein
MKNHYLCSLITFAILTNIVFGSIAQQLIFADELERLPDSDPAATITANGILLTWQMESIFIKSRETCFQKPKK